MKPLLTSLAILAAVGLPASAASFYVSPDAPTDLGGVTYEPWDILRNDIGSYTLLASLPPGTAVNALHRMCSGDWLVSVEAPAELPPGGGVFYEPRDVVLFGSATPFSHFFCGGGLGFPGGSNIDTLLLVGDDSSNLVIGFDTPTTIGAVTYEPADLVEFQRVGAGCNGWALVGMYHDASSTAPPVPLTSVMSAADLHGALTIMSFDVPSTIGGTYMPGELVSWDGVAVSSFAIDPNWAMSSRADALSFLPDPGSVPSLSVVKSSLIAGNLDISWLPATSAGVDDYGIYEGPLVKPWVYGHGAITCTDVGSDLLESIAPSTGSSYYLVVPWNANAEGSYGRRSTLAERPAGTGACMVPQGLVCP